MAVALTHTTVATGTDAGNAQIGKTQWNETHTLTMATSRLLGRTTAGTGAVEEITASTGLTLSAGALAVSKAFPTGDIVGTTDSQTLTNKTISGSSNTITNISLTTAVTGTLPVGNGGTGQTSYTDGQLLIGNSTGNTLTKATLTAGSGISITNGSGAITIASTGSMVYPGAGIAVSTGSAWGTSKTSPTGDIVGTSDTQTLTNKTLSAPTLSGNATGGDGLLTRVMLQDTGWDWFDSGTTNALDYVNGSVQRWAPNTGAQTLSISNWPPSGNLGELLIEGVNLGAATITWPTINWVTSNGTTTTTFSQNGVTLQTSGTDWVFLWTRDAGTTIYGKVVR